MAVDRASVQAAYTALEVPDTLLDDAIAYAEDRVYRVAGLPYDSTRETITATWRRLDYQAWPVTMNFPHRVASVSRVEFNGEQIGPGDYALYRDAGQIEVRHYFVWDTTAEIDYIPQDQNALRDAVQRQIATLYLARTMQYLPVAGGADPMKGSSWEQEDAALQRMQFRIQDLNLPQSHQYLVMGG